MNSLNKFNVIFVGLIVLSILVTGFFFIRVPVTTIGVKQNMWGDGGIDLQDYSTGYAVGVTGVHKWHYLDASTHFLHFIRSGGNVGSSRSYVNSRTDNLRTTGPLTIRTKDNNNAEIDITIPYRIISGRGHKIVVDGLKSDYPDRVKSTVEGVLRAELADLSSEQWQITDTRLNKVKSTLEKLNGELDRFHVKAHTILIRRIQFPAAYEKKLQEKQLLNQRANLDSALAKQSVQEQETNKIEKQIVAAEKKKTAEWELKIQEKTSEYQVLIAEINAKAKIYDQTTRAAGEANKEISLAKGKLAVAKAEALWTDLRNQVLNTKGGRLIVAKTAAENLKFGDIVLNSNDPATPKIINLDELTKLLIGKQP